MSLKTKIQIAGKTSNSTEKRRRNIELIKNLPREGLSYHEMERLIHITTTSFGEEIFIQYPGKETISGRPWDFRPKILLMKKNEGKLEKELHMSVPELDFYKDLEFKDIWEILFELLSKYHDKEKEKIARLFAILFYRMAFLIDAKIEDDQIDVKTKYLKYDNNGKIIEIVDKTEKIDPWYIYRVPSSAIEILKEISCYKIREISIEAFLNYNNLLAWNEDCKYFYRNLQKMKDKWLGKTGRVNTLLTHISIIGFVLGEIKLSTLLMKFVRGRGVGPVTNKEVRKICKDYII